MRLGRVGRVLAALVVAATSGVFVLSGPVAAITAGEQLGVWFPAGGDQSEVIYQVAASVTPTSPCNIVGGTVCAWENASGGAIGGGLGTVESSGGIASWRFSNTALYSVAFGLTVGEQYRVVVTWCPDSDGDAMAVDWVNGGPSTAHAPVAALGSPQVNGAGRCFQGSNVELVLDVTGAAPAGATGVRVYSTGTYTELRSVSVYSVTQTLGDCVGQTPPDYSADTTLLGDSPALSFAHARYSGQWGDFWAAVDSSILGETGMCVSLGDSTWEWFPAGGIPQGHRFSFSWVVRGYSDASSVAAWWIIGQRGDWQHYYPGAIMRGTAPIGEDWDAGAWSTLSNANGISKAPVGATGIAFQVGNGTAIELISVHDVTDTQYDMPGASSGYDETVTQDDTSATCAGPSSILDLGGLGAYLGCELAKVPGAIASSVSTILSWLFVPSNLGARMSDLMDAINTHAPFVWIGEVVGVVQTIVSPGRLAGASLPASFDFMGATISLDFSTWSAPLVPFRGILVGVLYFSTGFAAFRIVGRALGMGASGGEA